MSVFKKLLSLLSLFFVFFFVQVLMGGTLSQMLQGTSFVGVVGLTFCTSIHHLGARTTLAGFFHTLFGKSFIAVSPDELRRFQDGAPGWAMFSTNLVAFLGIIQVMTKLNNPSEIGHGIAVAFVAYLYGALMVLLVGIPRESGPDRARVKPNEVSSPLMTLVAVFFVVMYAISQH